MQTSSSTLIHVFGGILIAFFFACADPPRANPPADPSQKQQQQTQAQQSPGALPTVLSADGHLDCTISSKANGTQKLVLKSGQGLEFDVAVSPIVDGVVKTNGAEKGGSYRFTSHLAKAGKGSLSGVGEVTIDELDTKVNVEMDRYKQPAGAGTELSFVSEDMAKRGIYIEFAGRATAANGEHYAFKVTLGAPGPGSGGKVTPATNASSAPIAAKMVMVEAPQTTVVTGTTVTTTVNKVP
jgi:hypothetical protein